MQPGPGLFKYLICINVSQLNWNLLQLILELLKYCVNFVGNEYLEPNYQKIIKIGIKCWEKLCKDDGIIHEIGKIPEQIENNEVQYPSGPEPPENCHLNVKILSKTWYIKKICQRLS